MKTKGIKITVNRKLLIIAAVSAVVLVIAGLLAFSKPKIKLIGDAELTVEVQQIYSDAGAKATFLGFDISDRLSGSGSVDYEKTGVYKEVFTVKYLGKTAEAVRTVTVNDTAAPTVALNGDSEVFVEDLSLFEDEGVSAFDAYEGDLTQDVSIDMSSIQTDSEGKQFVVITYSVSDKSGNKSSIQRTVKIVDKTAPKITLNGSETITLKKGDKYNDRGATALDNIDGRVQVVVNGTVDTSKEGTYVLIYSASDSSGNRSERKRYVYVIDPVSPDVPATSSTAGKAPAAGGSYIYLTFDDGPSWDVTPKILDILKKYNVHATFFIINYSTDRIDLLRRMINEGHSVGIHGYSHDYAEIYRSPEDFMNNLYKLQNKLYRDTGYVSHLIRFPGGSSNAVSKKYCEGIMTTLTERVQNEGFSYVDWNVDSGDANGNGIAVSTLVSNAQNGLRQGRSNVILMHDTSAKQTTPAAVEQIIKYGRDNGYEFLALNDSSPKVHHCVNN